MTWFGWLLVVDIVISCGFFIVRNDDRKPLTPTELAAKVATQVIYLVGILAVGTGQL